MNTNSTIATYALDGNNRKFVVPFEYLARKFVVVTIGEGVYKETLTMGTDYRFINPNSIETTLAYPAAKGIIQIRRYTSATQRLVDFYDGSVLRSRDLNVSTIQTLHVAEEARDTARETLAENDVGNLDARGRRLVNLGAGVDPKDAVTKEQIESWEGSAAADAIRAEQSAQAAAQSASQSDAVALRHDLALRQDLANPDKGATMVGFKHSGVGAVARTQHDKNSDTVDVKDFNAKGDGITDDFYALTNTAKATEVVDLRNQLYFSSALPVGAFVNGVVKTGDYEYKHYGNTPIQKKGRLRIGSWNVWRTLIRDDMFKFEVMADFKSYIALFDCDFIGMQEVLCHASGYDDKMFRLPQHKHSILASRYKKSNIPYGNLLLAKYEAVASSDHGFDGVPDDPSSEKRAYSRSEFLIDGKTVAIYNTHLSHVKVNRELAIPLICDAVLADNSEVVVLVGDMNTGEVSNHFSALFSAGFLAVNNDEFDTFQGSAGFNPIDHIFYRGLALASDVYVESVPMTIADHRVIYADFNLL